MGACSGVAAAAGCGTSLPAGRYDLSVQSTDAIRSGVVFVPSSYTGKEKLPVVFDFHGSDSNPDGQLKRSSWDKVAEKNGFVVVALQGSLAGHYPGTHAWNVPLVTTAEGGLDEVGFITSALTQVKRDLCVDPGRIYASGYSGGGRMLSHYICSGHSDFAAAGFVHSLRAGAPVEVEGSWRPDPKSCSPARPISIMAFAGQKDTANPYAGGGKPYWQYGFKTAIQRWSELDGCSGSAKIETVGGVTYGTYDTCKNGARIASYVFADGTHAWPKPSATENVLAANAEAQAGLAKVATSSKPSFDPRVDPAERMWDFFQKADKASLVATAAPAAAMAGAPCAAATTSDEPDADLRGTTCSSISQPIEKRRSGQGAKGAL
ncbi:polyhydroxybutyrate depolymerase [Pseudorhizobium tarimense]|uniref:Polyhydroxybutyrate depolymerase n=1 Tax=Pseudorhizobium tarimense TaxID=1079109 RepID=A0ABV2H7H7_9HYPH|nr:PHB depolymerase family esterase [Pseudorhizobium tarimense]MCJ8519686.1 polyhydroxybutyrate depolymerase [Pseudorhizobium tarimense]